MGGVDVGEGGGKKRSTNSDINMIPFIDLLMCTIAFLLITAVWVTNSRINADAQVPGPPDPQKELNPQTPEKVLHLHINENDFSLVWKQGATVISENKVPKTAQEMDSGDGGKTVRYPDLAKKIAEEWNTYGSHKNDNDPKQDQAIISVDNRAPFSDLIAVVDAIYQPKRTYKGEQWTSFNVTFSAR